MHLSLALDPRASSLVTMPRNPFKSASNKVSRPSFPANPSSISPTSASSAPKVSPTQVSTERSAVQPGVGPTSQSNPTATTTPTPGPSSLPVAATPSTSIRPGAETSTDLVVSIGSNPPVVAAPTTSNSRKADVTSRSSVAVDNVALLLEVVETLSKFVKAVPFIGPVVMLLSQFVKIYEEVKDVKEKRDALCTRIKDVGQDLCATILRMETAGHIDLFTRLKPDIETYARLLERSSKFVSEYDSLGGIRRGVAHTQLGNQLSTLQQDLDTFGTRFRTNRLVDISIQQTAIEATAEEIHGMVVAEKLEKWFGLPPNMKQKQDDIQKIRKEGTGSWILNDNRFVEWQDNAGALWIQGNSGTGKSVLSSTLISKLMDDQQLFQELGKPSAVGFFYLDFKEKESRTVVPALRRIVLQLSAQSPHPYRALDKQYMLSKGQTLPNFSQLLEFLQKLLSELGRTYIVIDALDECDDAELEWLVDLVSTLWKCSCKGSIHVLITSQPRAIFTESFKGMPCILLDSSVTMHDIRLFISSEIRDNRKMKMWAARTNEIVDRIVKKSSGMFRLAACLLVELSRCRRYNELDQTLEGLPDDLFGVYDRFMEAIQPRDRVYATGVLRWLVFSTRSIFKEDHIDGPHILADAIAFDFSNPRVYTYDPNLREGNAHAILEWLEGLVTVQTRQIRFWQSSSHLVLAHSSVQNYILSKQFTDRFGFDLNSATSHTFITQSCIGYLLHFANNPLNSSTVDSYPLAKYAARELYHHLQHCPDGAIVSANLMQLLKDGSEQYTALAAACSGNVQIVQLLLDNGANVNVQGGEYGFALQAAAWRGKAEIVQLLLDNGANVNAQGGKFGCALQAASAEGETEIVRLLLDNGANVNVQAGKFGCALQAASAKGETEIVLLLLNTDADAAAQSGKAEIVKPLLDNGADVNAQGGKYGFALQAAAWEGEARIVQLLLDNGADINTQGGEYGSALQAAACSGNVQIVQFLLDNGANVNVQGGEYGFALQAAASRGKAGIVQLLLDNDANVNAQGGKFGCALQAASVEGETKIVKLLLDNGADVNAQAGKFGCALQAASAGGETGIVRLLLDNGANVKAQGGLYGCALQAAVWKGNAEITQVLLSKGAVVNCQGGEYGFPLQAAAWRGKTETVQLLLNKGADVNAQGGKFGCALQAASAEGETKIVKFLLTNGADVNAQGGVYGCALQAASAKGKLKVVHILLEHGAQVDAHGGVFGSALHAASQGTTEIFHLLLENGADVNSHGGLYGSALQVASLGGKTEHVWLLLNHGANPNARGGLYGSALHAACSEGKTAVVRLLLEQGAEVNAPGGISGSLLEVARELMPGVAPLLLQDKDHWHLDKQIGWTGSALQAAASRGHTEVVELLLESGAIDARDNLSSPKTVK
ncbi:ankyrin repeat-containing domain protein [Mycena capillaripes]|nr:ankyrin repeat-containing domain protein [Mycena capillaripes]